MKKALTIVTILGSLLLLAAPAAADWNEGDGHKMHWPQLPNPEGWDVNITRPNDDSTTVVADDWKCTERGPVRDIHFWFSVEGDEVDQALVGFEKLHVSIHKDIPDPDGPEPGYSMPGEELWRRDFTLDQIQIPTQPRYGDQGWADPAADPQVWRRPDHQMYFQANIVDIQDPFYQRGTADEPVVYWLDLWVDMKDDGVTYPPIGWKTTFPKIPGVPPQEPGGWGDDAVYWDIDDTGNEGWQELWEYGEPEISLDMAFVITPEPSSVAMLLAVGVGIFLAYAQRRRRR